MPGSTAIKRKRDTEHHNRNIRNKRAMTTNVDSYDSDVDTALQTDDPETDRDTDEASNITEDVTDSLDDKEDEETESEADDEFPWLKSIEFPINRSDDSSSPQIGYCMAQLIDREPIRATFHRDMEEPTRDTSCLGFDLFDRWGNLKSELQHHPVKKGTNVWGPELNSGRILLIEEMSINEDHQRQGYGRKAFDEAWQRAQTLSATKGLTTPGCDFAVVWATYLPHRAMVEETKDLSRTEKEAYYKKKQDVIEDFWRALGFRRIGSSPYFGFANDPTHASHLLPSEKDYRRPAALRWDPHVEGQDFPQSENLIKATDSETRSMLERRLESHPAAESTWLLTDRHGNNILHQVAQDSKTESVGWLLSMPFAASLRTARNLEGETPLEALLARLETSRTYHDHMMMQVVACDKFAGSAPNQVACLSQLKGLTDPSRVEIQRLSFGCTCGQCIEGFLSPRAVFAIECQAGLRHDTLDGEISTSSGAKWCENHYYVLEHLDPYVKNNMRTNKSLRQGFTNILGYIVESLRAKQMPVALNVLAFAEGEWPPHTKNYLQGGGTVLAVLQACFDAAIKDDLYLGHGVHEEFFKDDIEKLPACRNDREFVFARRQIRKLEGLPDEENPRWGMGGIW